MRITGPKTKLARRLGEPLRDKDAKYLVKRNFPPGMHGEKRSRKSDFGIQLAEKQKAKWMYGVSERQFRRYIKESFRKKGRIGETLLEFLELRLDNVVYRLGFASSRAQARQLVGHGFFAVNSKKVNIPSYKLRIGDEVAVVPNKQNSIYVQRLNLSLKEYKPQEWLSLDSKNLSGKVLSLPTAENTGFMLRTELIIEHYNR